VRTAIVIDKSFDTIWPFSADRLHQLLSPMLETSFVRLSDVSTRWVSSVERPAAVERLILLGPIQLLRRSTTSPPSKKPSSAQGTKRILSKRHWRREVLSRWSTDQKDFGVSQSQSLPSDSPSAHCGASRKGITP